MTAKLIKMNQKKAIYCRISSQMQSTDRQREDLLQVAKNLNYHIDEGNIYVDIITGYSVAEERPRYSALLAEVNKGNIDTILFSELTRLGRNSTELLSEVQRLQNKGVNLYFDKQNLWVKTDKQDLGSRILLAVLAITTSYEIELFAERSISGKINKVKNGGGIGGDNNAYGYMNDENKKMVIRDDEAEIIRKIFNMYADGKSTIDICDILNSEHVPTSYTTRIKEFKIRRKQKGLAPKKYNFEDEDNFQWRPSAIAKILNNELYKGHRKIKFHKPEVDKLKKEEKEKEQKEREIIYEYDVHLEDLRIVSDELFQLVQDRLAKAAYNKNNAIKHDNLLKAKLVCGECGSNFSVGKQSDTATKYKSDPRTYKCYGRVRRKDKPQICKTGAEIRQWKLDGLVLTLSLKMFAEINIAETNDRRIAKLNDEIADAIKVKNDKQNLLDTLDTDYKKQMNRLSRMKGQSEKIVRELMDEAQKEYEKTFLELSASITKKKEEITTKTNTINRLKRLAEQYTNIYDKMDEIWHSKELVKAMVDEYIKEIILFKITPMWNLVIVKYNNEYEFWGTIKAARYRNDEMFYDEMVCRHGIEFKTWIINNSDHSFTYDPKQHAVTYNGQSDIYTAIPKGTYTYEEMDKILYEIDWIGSFPFYDFENIKPLNQESLPDFMRDNTNDKTD